MKRFREQTNPHIAAPIYDGEAVRDVLARASQIEQESQTDAPMTAEQIETLGQELGMSSDAVRRALGEKATVRHASTQTASLPPVTRADVTKAAKLSFAYSMLALICFMAFTYFLKVNPYPGVGVGVLLVALVLLVCAAGYVVLPCVYAWRRKDWRQGLLFGALLTPIYGIHLIAMICFNYALYRYRGDIDASPLVPFILTSLCLGWLGGVAGKWWDDRRRAEER